LSWGSIIGIGCLGAVGGAASAVFLTYKCIEWYRMGTHDQGEFGYYLVFVPVGLACGFIAGALIARVLSGFWLSLGVVMGALMGLCLIAALVGRAYGEVAPELDGDQLMLQVELNCPAGWQPDSDALRAEGRSCRLQPMGPGRRMAPAVYGTLDWNTAHQSDGRWIVPCEVKLVSSRENRLVAFALGKQWVEFNLQLPPYPTAANKDWSAWIVEGFSQQVGKPPTTGFAYRCRVKGIRAIRDEEAAARTAFWQQREDAARSIPADAPIERWLPLFEDPGGIPAQYRWGGADRTERRSVATRVLELGPMLASKDKTVMRQAVFAIGSLYETPPVLVPPLLGAAGHFTLEMIREAKAQAEMAQSSGTDPGTRPLQYFDMWSRAIRNAGPIHAPELRALLQDVRRETAGCKGDLWILGNQAKELEQSLPPAATR
jgi:hypothetical protein